jgi:hypothetical protein
LLCCLLVWLLFGVSWCRLDVEFLLLTLCDCVEWWVSGVVCSHSCVVCNVRILVMLIEFLCHCTLVWLWKSKCEWIVSCAFFLREFLLSCYCLKWVFEGWVVKSFSISVVVCALVSLTMWLLPEAKCSVCVLLLLLLTDFDCSVVDVE